MQLFEAAAKLLALLASQGRRERHRELPHLEVEEA